MKPFAEMPLSTSSASMFPRSATVTFGALLLALVLPTDAAWGRGKPPPPPPSPPPSPDIVYTSYTTNAPSSPAIRGVTLASDGLSGTDTQLAKAKADRESGSIVWSPDGSRYAWVEGAWQQTRSIMVAVPGQAGTPVYSAAWGNSTDPYPGSGADELDWGPGCTPGTSVLVFRGYGGPNSSPIGIMAIDNPDQLGAPVIPRLLSNINAASGFALSPTGQHLAFRFMSRDEKVWMLPMCTAVKTPVVLVNKAAIGAADDFCIDPTKPASPTNGCYPDWAITSIDWSRHGDRLALSVVVGPDPDYPWRDLKIVYLNYTLPGGVETVTARVVDPVFTVNLDNDSRFGAASSEHSPRWGPSNTGDTCQRIAFSQSAGASDGSSTNGRHLYLLDVNDGRLGDCQLNTPLLIDSKVPRALDWK